MKKLSNLNAKSITAKFAVISTMAACLATGASASGFYVVAQPVVSLLNSLLGPLLAIVGAAGALYCIVLGVKFAKAEEPQDREKAKQHLKNAIIGYILIFVLIVVLNLLKTPMINWVNQYAGNIIDAQVTATPKATTAVK